jgi:hypothetical protein
VPSWEIYPKQPIIRSPLPRLPEPEFVTSDIKKTGRGEVVFVQFLEWFK